MKSVFLILAVLLVGFTSSAQLLQPETMRTVVSEQLQCRYQLRNEGYSQAMPFTLDVKVVAFGGTKYLEVSLSSVSRFFSALNVSVRSSEGFLPVAGAGAMMRMQAAVETGVNSKAEVLGRTIKLQVTDPDGKDWRSVSCLRDGLSLLVTTSTTQLRVH